MEFSRIWQSWKEIVVTMIRLKRAFNVRKAVSETSGSGEKRKDDWSKTEETSGSDNQWKGDKMQFYADACRGHIKDDGCTNRELIVSIIISTPFIVLLLTTFHSSIDLNLGKLTMLRLLTTILLVCIAASFAQYYGPYGGYGGFVFKSIYQLFLCFWFDKKGWNNFDGRFELYWLKFV